MSDATASVEALLDSRCESAWRRAFVPAVFALVLALHLPVRHQELVWDDLQAAVEPCPAQPTGLGLGSQAGPRLSPRVAATTP